MPEIPRWVIVTAIVVAVVWIFSQVSNFVSKVNTTVDKANTSISRDKDNLQQVNY